MNPSQGPGKVREVKKKRLKITKKENKKTKKNKNNPILCMHMKICETGEMREKTD